MDWFKFVLNFVVVEVWNLQPNAVANAYDPSTWMSEAGGLSQVLRLQIRLELSFNLNLPDYQ